MVFQKNYRGVVLAWASALALLFSPACKKLKTKDLIVFSVKALIPQSGAPVAGVKYRVVEYKYQAKFGKPVGNPKPTGWEMTGHTDIDGIAKGAFQGVLKSNYSYNIIFDYGEMQLPTSITNYTISGPQFDKLSRSNPKDNQYEIRILPMGYMRFRIENITCATAADSMRFKVFNFDEFPHQDFQYIPYGNYFVGCGVLGDYTNPNLILAGHQVYQMEITRNGVTTTTIDTFNLQPNIVNDVFLEY